MAQLPHSPSEASPDLPTAAVLDQFGSAVGLVQGLAGGEETSVRIGNIVFKRSLDVDVSIWCQELLARTTLSRVRVPRPLPTKNGERAADGWIATEFIAGLASLESQPKTVIVVGELFADAIFAAGAGNLAPVLGREDRWARADRFVWGEEVIDLSEAANEIAGRLRSRMTDTAVSSQVVHADLSGNVFADADGVPVVLDFSPCVRPKVYASAIVVADNLLWRGAGSDIFTLIGGDEDALARALLFRLVADQLGHPALSEDGFADFGRAMSVVGWAF